MKYNKCKRLLLFDIDDTLTCSPQDSSLGVVDALSEGFGMKLSDCRKPWKAGTAIERAEDILKSNGINQSNTSDYLRKLDKSKEAYTRIVEKGLKDGSFSWRPLPNVCVLLRVLSKRKDVKLALLTANPRQIAKTKLKSAGIDVELFMESSELFGSFGCEHADRSELVKKAKQRYCNLIGVPDVEPEDMIVIGDTPKDISCAHDNDVPCVAVATGKYKAKDLEKADCVLEHGFKDLSASVAALLETRRS